MKKHVFLIALALCCAAAAHAEKKPVRITCTIATDDWIGKRLCTRLHDTVAKSPRYRETENPDEWAWGLRLVSHGSSNAQSAQAIIVTLGGYPSEFYVDASLSITGADKVERQTQNIIAFLDEDVRNHPY